MTFGAFLALGHLKLGSGGRGSRLHIVTLMGRRILVYVPFSASWLSSRVVLFLFPDGPRDGHRSQPQEHPGKPAEWVCRDALGAGSDRKIRSHFGSCLLSSSCSSSSGCFALFSSSLVHRRENPWFCYPLLSPPQNTPSSVIISYLSVALLGVFWGGDIRG